MFTNIENKRRRAMLAEFRIGKPDSFVIGLLIVGSIIVGALFFLGEMQSLYDAYFLL